MARNAYWITRYPGTAKIVEAPSANIARHKFARAETIVFPNVVVKLFGLERCVENYVHEVLNAEQPIILNLTDLVTP